MKTIGLLVGLALFGGLVIVPQSSAQVSGSFWGALYSSEFGYDSGVPIKDISVETNLVSFPSADQLTLVYGAWETARSISEPRTMFDGEYRYYSHFSIVNEPDADTDDSPISWNPYLRGQLPMDGDSEFSLYFSSNTNLAFVMGRDIDDSESDEGSETLGVMVRKGTGLSNSVLNGHYIGFGIGGHFDGNSEYGPGNIENLSFVQREAVFDGNGHWQGSKSLEVKNLTYSNLELMTNGDTLVFTKAELSNATNISSQVSNAFYSVSADGAVFLTNSASGQVETFFTSPDGEVLISGSANSNYSCRLNVALRTPENMTMDDLAGKTYTGMIMTDELASDDGSFYVSDISIEQELFYVSFLSNGVFTIREDSWIVCNNLTNSIVMQDGNLVCTNQITTDLPRRVIYPSTQGTYSVSSNGVVELSFGGEDTGVIFISSTGQFAVSGYIDADPESGEMERALIVAVLRDPPPEASSPVVLDSELSFSSSGACFAASSPTNTPFEIICTDDLQNDEWYGVGVYTNQTGLPIQVCDPDATNAPTRYYRACTLPW